MSSEEILSLEKMNKMGYNALILCCKDATSFLLVKNCKTLRFPKGDANMAWLQLKDKFEPDDGQTLIETKRAFANSKLEDVTTDPDDWITRLLDMVARLQELGSNVNENYLVLHIVYNLPKE